MKNLIRQLKPFLWCLVGVVATAGCVGEHVEVTEESAAWSGTAPDVESGVAGEGTLVIYEPSEYSFGMLEVSLTHVDSNGRSREYLVHMVSPALSGTHRLADLGATIYM